MHGPVLPSSFIGHCEGGVLRFGTTVFFNSEVFSCTYTQCDLYQQACDALPQSTFFARVSFDAVLEFYRISNSCIYIYIYTKLDGQLGTLFIEAVSGMGHHAGTLNFFQLIISNSKPSIFRRPGLGRLRRKLSKRRARLLSSKGMVQRSINKRTGKRSVSGT